MMSDSTTKTRAKPGLHPNSLKNLKPFQKGNHASPGRPPKADCLISCIKAALAQVPAGSTKTNEQLIADILVSKAAQGDTKAIELLMTYTTPKPAVDAKLSGEVLLRVIEDGNSSA